MLNIKEVNTINQTLVKDYDVMIKARKDEIGYITSDNKIIYPIPDLMEDISDEICDRLKDFVGVYAV